MASQPPTPTEPDRPLSDEAVDHIRRVLADYRKKHITLADAVEEIRGVVEAERGGTDPDELHDPEAVTRLFAELSFSAATTRLLARAGHHVLLHSASSWPPYLVVDLDDGAVLARYANRPAADTALAEAHRGEA